MSAEKFAGIMEFVQVVERGSFTSASNILGVSKSHISKQVTQLEDRLKTRLIQRSTRKLRLTDEGEHYYKHCSLAITDLENVAMELGQHRQTPKGILKISTPVTLGEFFISSLLADFVAKHTDLQVEFNMSTENVQLIDDGYDLAIRIGHLEDSSLIARPLANIEFCVLASKEYIEINGNPTHIEELDNHNCLVCSPHGPQVGANWKFAGSKPGLTRERKVKGNWSCNNCYALISAARKGLGLIWLPNVLVATDVATGSLVTLLDQVRLPSTIWAVYPQRKHIPAKVSQFVDYLYDAFNPTPPWQDDSVNLLQVPQEENKLAREEFNTNH